MPSFLSNQIKHIIITVNNSKGLNVNKITYFLALKCVCEYRSSDHNTEKRSLTKRNNIYKYPKSISSNGDPLIILIERGNN